MARSAARGASVWSAADAGAGRIGWSARTVQPDTMLHCLMPLKKGETRSWRSQFRNVALLCQCSWSSQHQRRHLPHSNLVQNFVVTTKLNVVNIGDYRCAAAASRRLFDVHQPSGGSFGVYLLLIFSRRSVRRGVRISRRGVPRSLGRVVVRRVIYVSSSYQLSQRRSLANNRERPALPLFFAPQQRGWPNILKIVLTWLLNIQTLITWKLDCKLAPLPGNGEHTALHHTIHVIMDNTRRTPNGHSDHISPVFKVDIPLCHDLDICWLYMTKAIQFPNFWCLPFVIASILSFSCRYLVALLLYWCLLVSKGRFLLDTHLFLVYSNTNSHLWLFLSHNSVIS